MHKLNSSINIPAQRGLARRTGSALYLHSYIRTYVSRVRGLAKRSSSTHSHAKYEFTFCYSYNLLAFGVKPPEPNRHLHGRGTSAPVTTETMRAWSLWRMLKWNAGWKNAWRRFRTRATPAFDNRCSAWKRVMCMPRTTPLTTTTTC